MFAKTRARLTLLNAAVFLVVLAVIGTVVYALLRAQIYDRLDAGLMAAAQRFAPADEPSRRYEQRRARRRAKPERRHVRPWSAAPSCCSGTDRACRIPLRWRMRGTNRSLRNSARTGRRKGRLR